MNPIHIVGKGFLSLFFLLYITTAFAQPDAYLDYKIAKEQERLNDENSGGAFDQISSSYQAAASIHREALAEEEKIRKLIAMGLGESLLPVLKEKDDDFSKYSLALLCINDGRLLQVNKLENYTQDSAYLAMFELADRGLPNAQFQAGKIFHELGQKTIIRICWTKLKRFWTVQHGKVTGGRKGTYPGITTSFPRG